MESRAASPAFTVLLGLLFDGSARPMATTAALSGLAAAALAGRYLRGPR